MDKEARWGGKYRVIFDPPLWHVERKCGDGWKRDLSYWGESAAFSRADDLFNGERHD